MKSGWSPGLTLGIWGLVEKNQANEQGQEIWIPVAWANLGPRTQVPMIIILVPQLNHSLLPLRAAAGLLFFLREQGFHV